MRLLELHQITLSLVLIILMMKNRNRIIQRMERMEDKKLNNQFSQVSLGVLPVVP